jgi:hypothetical protein
MLIIFFVYQSYRIEEVGKLQIEFFENYKKDHKK